MAKWFFGRSLATGFLTGLRRLLCSVAERWPVEPTSTPAPSPPSPPAPKSADPARGAAWGASSAGALFEHPVRSRKGVFRRLVFGGVGGGGWEAQTVQIDSCQAVPRVHRTGVARKAEK